MLRCFAGAERSVTRQQQPSASASTSSAGLLTSMMARMLHCSRPEAPCNHYHAPEQHNLCSCAHACCLQGPVLPTTTIGCTRRALSICCECAGRRM